MQVLNNYFNADNRVFFDLWFERDIEANIDWMPYYVSDQPQAKFYVKDWLVFRNYEFSSVTKPGDTVKKIFLLEWVKMGFLTR